MITWDHVAQAISEAMSEEEPEEKLVDREAVAASLRQFFEREMAEQANARPEWLPRTL